MSHPVASRSFPASPTQLRNVRDFVMSACPEGTEHLPLLATEIANLLFRMAPSLTLRLVDHGDRIGVEARLDAVRDTTDFSPGGLARLVIDGLTDELTINLDDLVVTARTPIRHPAYAGS